MSDKICDGLMLNKLVLFISFLFLLSSCNFGGGLSVRYNYPSVGEGSAPSDSEYFYIDLDVDKYKAGGNLVPFYEISTTTEYGDAEERDSLSNCEIYYQDSEESEADQKTASDDGLICILDLMEYDFMVKDVHLTYNFPEGMCDYVETSLPWHFNHEILPGPCVRVCLVSSTNDEGEAEEREITCDLRDYEQDYIIGVNDGCESLISCAQALSGSNRCLIGDDGDEDVDELCESQTEEPKCCNGGDKGDDEDWKPELECFGGPSLVAEMDGHSKEKFYYNLLSVSPEGGLNGTITLPDLISINNAEGRTISPLANYLKTLDRPFEQLKSISREKDLPDFLKISPNYKYSPNLFFKFLCKDAAGEVLHKILLMIREWNTREEFMDFYDEGGDDSADPDVEGIEGADCDYEDFRTLSGEIEPCNDLLDLDNIENCQGYGRCLIFNRDRKIYPRIPYSESSDSVPSE